MRSSVTHLVRALIFGLLLTGLLFGQNASVSGQVVDSQGGSVPGATVTLTQSATNRVVHTQSNPDGYFQLPPVVPGSYEMTAKAKGFALAKVTGITLEVEESKVVKLVLQPGQRARDRQRDRYRAGVDRRPRRPQPPDGSQPLSRAFR